MNATYTIVNGGEVIARAPVNQQQPPGDLRDAGISWADLGGLGNLFAVKGSTLVVRLSNSGGRNGPGALAGPVRVERIYDPAGGGDAGPLISSADAVRFLEQSTWGPNDGLLNHFLNDLGADPQAFLNEQYNAPYTGYPPPVPALPAAMRSCRYGRTPDSLGGCQREPARASRAAWWLTRCWP